MINVRKIGATKQVHDSLFDLEDLPGAAIDMDRNHS